MYHVLQNIVLCNKMRYIQFLENNMYFRTTKNTEYRQIQCLDIYQIFH